MDRQSTMGSRHLEFQGKREKRKHLAQICHTDWITNFFNIKLPAVSNNQSAHLFLTATVLSLNLQFCSREQRSALHQGASLQMAFIQFLAMRDKLGGRHHSQTKPTCGLSAGWVLASLSLNYWQFWSFVSAIKLLSLLERFRWKIKVCSWMWTYYGFKVKDQPVVTSLKDCSISLPNDA